jgi:type I restriction-modification system DNA methylase subunit
MLTKERAKDNLVKLTQKFESELTSGSAQEYNEEATKTAFIQPLLEDVLGWDVSNRDEVSPEENTSKGRVDYGLKINGQIKIFIEAKPIKADLEKHIEQAVRYGYNRKDVPFVLLTDFEGIKLFDVTVKPDLRNPLKGLKLNLTWKQYLPQFDKLWLLSKESVKNGELDKLLLIKPKDRIPVDKAIFADLKKWRESLASDIFKNNQKLFNSQDSGKDAEYLKEITQKILDRITFMRSCEDRGLVHRRTLRDLFEGRTEAVGMNTMLFLEEETKHYHIVFDSDLFSPQEWEEKLAVTFSVMKEIILETYNPYQFDVIPIEVLGNIYEQYLGYTIRLTEHQIKYELKPDVRKAGGVYYTPEYIVEYIVTNTVGKLLKELSPQKIKKMRILDPACGSGSFLIRAYEEMLNYYRKQKKAEQRSDEKQKSLGFAEISSERNLTLQEKSEILRRHIFGVDIDEQAVEVTKLSLMLKMLEGEHGFIPGRAVLPMLDRNIRCGNSLISGDTLELKKFFGEEWYKVKSFDWEKKFEEIVGEEGGFDVVIGNPPYGGELSNSQRKYLEKRFKLQNTDTACLFMGLALTLLKKNGINGFIIPKPFVYASNWDKIREKLLNGLLEIVDCGKVWNEVKLEQVVYSFQRNIKNRSYRSCVREGQNIKYLGSIDKETFKEFGFYLNGISPEELRIGRRVKNSSSLFTKISYIVRGRDIQNDLVSANYAKKIYRCKSIARYFLKKAQEGITAGVYKNLKKDIEYMESPKILIQNIVAHVEHPRDHIILMATKDDNGILSLGSVGNIFLKTKDYNRSFLLGILNSKFISWYVYRFIYGKAIRTMRFDNYHLEQTPFPGVDLSKKDEKQLYDNLVALVDIMLDLNKKTQSAKGNEKEQIQRQIDKTDKEIDDIVYKLYGISEEERKIIEAEA